MLVYITALLIVYVHTYTCSNSLRNLSTNLSTIYCTDLYYVYECYYEYHFLGVGVTFNYVMFCLKVYSWLPFNILLSQQNCNTCSSGLLTNFGLHSTD